MMIMNAFKTTIRTDIVALSLLEMQSLPSGLEWSGPLPPLLFPGSTLKIPPSSLPRQSPFWCLLREHLSEYSSWDGEDSPSESSSSISGDSSETPSSIGDESSADNSRQALLGVSEEIVASSRETETEHDTPYVRPGLISPGFSFSAAGFLFPYHIGVARCLIEHGYITVCIYSVLLV